MSGSCCIRSSARPRATVSIVSTTISTTTSTAIPTAVSTIVCTMRSYILYIQSIIKDTQTLSYPMRSYILYNQSIVVRMVYTFYLYMVSKIAKQKTPIAKHQTHQLTNYHPTLLSLYVLFCFYEYSVLRATSAPSSVYCIYGESETATETTYYNHYYANDEPG